MHGNGAIKYAGPGLQPGPVAIIRRWKLKGGMRGRVLESIITKGFEE